VAEALEATKLGTPKGAAIVWKPKSGTPVSNDDSATLVKLLDALDDDDDVSNVYSNVELSDEQAEALAG
jgi:transcriptional/translational regulatory protein YebC/TACO1